MVPPPGKFDGGTITLGGIAPGSKADYVMFAWGSEWENFNSAATAGLWYGYAGPFTTDTGGGDLPARSLADSFRGMTIIGSWEVVPEPSSFALLAFGFWTVFTFRLRRI